MIGFENGYNVPNIKFDIILCKTNIPHKQHMRGTGVPIGAFFMDTVLDHAARHLSLDPTDVSSPHSAVLVFYRWLPQVRRMHLIEENSETIWGQKIRNCNMYSCWEKIIRDSDFDYRVKKVKEFNK